MLLLRLSQVGTEALDQVEQPDNQLPRPFILDLAQIKFFKHKLICIMSDCAAALLEFIPIYGILRLR